uniref:Adenylate kinase n=1 Tax=Alexandrium andersonii TaxID=327968 RepID=A0A7S2AZX9_9DINO|mmetsp:Transcript_2031/g.4508  ORF Transcript_2031/g.4508 Transcript_2031/m.4508 type:complete len:164 (+) Transcript_2031:3-494(+)
MDKGEYVPDHFMCRLVKDRLAQPDVLEHGCLLDGFPRKLCQAMAMSQEGIAVKNIVFIDVPNEDELRERACGRRMGPSGEIFHIDRRPPPPELEGQLKHRADDNPQTFKKRWETYQKEGPPMEGFLGDTYHDRFQKINGLSSIDQVFERIQKVFEPMHAAMRP